MTRKILQQLRPSIQADFSVTAIEDAILLLTEKGDKPLMLVCNIDPYYAPDSVLAWLWANYRRVMYQGVPSGILKRANAWCLAGHDYVVVQEGF